MDHQLLPKVAWIGNDYLQGPIRGIVLRTTALGVTEWKDAPDNMELEWAGHGALVVKPYHDPWAWMNRRTRDFLDDFLATLRGAYKLGDNIPLITAGGSMGGHGALMYSVHAQKRVSACLAICPPCDLVYQYSARQSTPRTLHHAFDNYGDISTQLAEHSPLHRVQDLPDIPYLIVHGAQDVDVSVKHHSDALVAAMKARNLRVEYHRPPLMTHSGGCDFPAYRRLIDFVTEHLAP